MDSTRIVGIVPLPTIKKDPRFQRLISRLLALSPIGENGHQIRSKQLGFQASQAEASFKLNVGKKH